jgi:hypothetical protein
MSEWHNPAGRKALEAALLEANEAQRIHSKQIGRMVSHGAHGAQAGAEVLQHVERVVAERAAAAAATRPPAPKAKRKPAAKAGGASRAKAPKGKPTSGRKARARGK